MSADNAIQKEISRIRSELLSNLEEQLKHRVRKLETEVYGAPVSRDTDEEGSLTPPIPTSLTVGYVTPAGRGCGHQAAHGSESCTTVPATTCQHGYFTSSWTPATNSNGHRVVSQTAGPVASSPAEQTTNMSAPQLDSGISQLAMPGAPSLGVHNTVGECGLPATRADEPAGVINSLHAAGTPLQRSFTTLTPTNTGYVASPSSLRYVGRSDPIPEFDPQKTLITMELWIRKIEGISNMYGWDEKTTIFNTSSKLRGYARQWFDNLIDVNVTWSDFKSELMVAFPSHKSKLNMLRDLVNVVRKPDDDYMQFYYDKLALGNACGLLPSLTTEIIIGTIGSQIVEVGAVSAACNDPTNLLKYLSALRTAEGTSHIVPSVNSSFKKLRCNLCKRRGHIATNCNYKARDKATICAFCRKSGHTEDKCFRKAKKCTYCGKSGHSKEECLKLKARKSHNNNNNNSNAGASQSVHVIKDQSSSSKYYLNAKVNDRPVKAFIDFGSSCITITKSTSQKLNLEVQPCQSNSVISGFGGSKIIPIGEAYVKVCADEASCDASAYIVPDSAQDIGVIIGQPFTDYPDVYVIKTPTCLKMYNANNLRELPAVCEDVEHVKLFTDSSVTLSPGVNKIIVSCDQLLFGHAVVRHTEHQAPRAECVIPQSDIEFIDGKAVMNIINTSNSAFDLPVNRCVARAAINDSGNTYKIGDDLEPDVLTKLESILQEYSECFSGVDDDRIGKCSVKMHIELTDKEKVVYYRPYRMSASDRDKVRNIVSDLRSKGIVEESTSPYASPVILVTKKTGEPRMVVDYRALNKITKKERYPLPLIQDQLDRLSNARVFSCLDILSAYHCIQIDDESKHYTAFITPDGLYQYTRMSFGLVNAPAVFQRAIDEILGPLKFKFSTAYLDDILIYSNSEIDALDHLRAILERIRDANVTLRLDKCSFLVSRVEYLGHEVCNGEVKPAQHKLNAVHDFKQPENVHHARQFMGLANYFRKYIRNFASLAQPITLLTKKDQPWVWGAAQQQAFDSIKNLLVSRPVLLLFHPEYETQVHTDASKIGLGGILLQKPPNGTYQPVAYASRQTTTAEQSYHSFELETLAVVMSLQKFKVYLTGLKFTIVTDCNALRWTWSKRDLNPRIARWWLEIQGFNFDVEYRPGKAMAHVDALSRNPVESVMRCTDGDLIESIQHADDSIRSTIEQLKNETSVGNNNGLERDYVLENNVLFRKVNGQNKVVVPRQSRWSIMQTFHDNNGHANYNKTYDAIKQKYWFSGMRRFVQKYVGGCISCQYAKKPTGRKVGLLHPIEKVAVPFHTVHVDHLGPFCKSPSGKMYILAIIDAFTRFIWIEAVRDAGCDNVLKTFDQYIKTFGLPSRIISDRGKAFDCHEFKRYCRDRQIKHVLTAVASPRANGQVERFNRTILDALVAYLGEEDQNRWEEYLPKVQLGINSNTNNSTGKSPLELLYGFRPRLSGDIVVPTRSDISSLRAGAITRSQEAARRSKVNFDKKRREGAPFKEGDLVLAERKVFKKGLRSGKLMPRFDGPFTVRKVLPHDRYLIRRTTSRGRPYENVLARDKLKPLQYPNELTSDTD